MADQWNMPDIPRNARGEPQLDFAFPVKPAAHSQDVPALPAYPNGNENIAPRRNLNLFPQHWPQQPPPPQRTFVQYQGPGIPPIRQPPGALNNPALQATAGAIHGNMEGNLGAALLYGYDGPRQMPVNMAGLYRSTPAGQFGPAMGDTWKGDPAAAWDNEQSRTSRKRNSRKETPEDASEESDSGTESDSSDEDRGKGKARKKVKKKTKKTPARGRKKGKGKGEGGRAKPKSGAGSKSGDNRRDTGVSDDEIARLTDAVKHAAEPRLSQAQLKAANQQREGKGRAELDAEGSDDEGSQGLNDEEKLHAVEWLTTPERYAEIRTSLDRFCVLMAQSLFRERVSAAQIARYWNNNAFKKYKAIRAQLPHTGGGDPDAVHQGGLDAAPPGSSQHQKQLSDVTFKAAGKFSSDTLLEFYNSKLYDLIDAVAHSDSAVQRVHIINSSDPVFESPKKRAAPGAKQEHAGSSSKAEELLEEAFRDLSERSKIAQQLDKERLELEKRREAREEEERAERREMRRQQERREAQAAREVKWNRAIEMSKSDVPELRERGLKLIAQLAEEEEEE
ncbi:hypothetical protein DICSQDRAFT_172776 [Dichomitus squalens LYAD-421 SS1]|uniref:Uncharacterized protein n=1 Tax=Dichomitus squalens (strain LYAD-421) TaxID=732165 RepID=R7SQW3_DICSQ|nr:uncharacterized protein DICSQDRAFT_172776 [Dichomitus squalens LYAD-421 SS1]EJF58574.1 hypothetical protein DICSQDRAFT_172776 [Dichomitus squalens LYAD-421 SS1]